MKLKVCGMKYDENIQAVASLQPDYFGFIFYEKSLRNFTEKIPKIPENIKKVGVFVDENTDTILSKITKHDLEAIQLHGQEPAEFCTDLRKMLNQIQHNRQVEIIKVFLVDNEFDFNQLKPYETCVDYYLFDTKGELAGGNGFVFDWTVLNKYPSKKPYFLSGGIGLDEIDKLQSFLQIEASKHCYAIDVNSRFEIKPGLKSIEKLKEFKFQLS